MFGGRMSGRAGRARLARRNAFDEYSKAEEMLVIFEITTINVWRTDVQASGRAGPD